MPWCCLLAAVCVQDEPKSVVDQKLREHEEAEARAAEARAKAKARSKKPGVPRAASAKNVSAPPPSWDDVGYTIKVLLFANRMQLLR